MQDLHFWGHIVQHATARHDASTQASHASVARSTQSSTVAVAASEGGFTSRRDDGAAQATTDEEETLLIPCDVPGRILGRSDRQVFAKTAACLEMGMCGGPVVNARGEVVGVVEGIVASPTSATSLVGAETAAAASTSAIRAATQTKRSVTETAASLLAGAAVFVECDDLRYAVDHVESQLL
ncbi:MAG: hypothetical protein EOO65_01605 [Methanosarcinales archaeon]|nr:MAG: hypothetical protein EOO65_01605 [Methanosarcinales archaeon]